MRSIPCRMVGVSMLIVFGRSVGVSSPHHLEAFGEGSPALDDLACSCCRGSQPHVVVEFFHFEVVEIPESPDQPHVFDVGLGV